MVLNYNQILNVVKLNFIWKHSNRSTFFTSGSQPKNITKGNQLPQQICTQKRRIWAGGKHTKCDYRAHDSVMMGRKKHLSSVQKPPTKMLEDVSVESDRRMRWKPHRKFQIGSLIKPRRWRRHGLSAHYSWRKFAFIAKVR